MGRIGLISPVCLYTGRLGRYARRMRHVCRHSLPGILNQGELARLAAVKHDCKSAEHHVPILAPSMPVLYNPLSRQIQHSAQRIIVGKGYLVLGDLAELQVQALNDIRRVNHFSNFLGILKEGIQNFPVFLLVHDAGRILLPPSFRKDAQILLCLVQLYSGVDFL